MTNDEIVQKLQENLPNASIEIEGDGYHFIATVISADFEDLPLVKRQQSIYKILQEDITSGAIHALTINALTPEEHRAKE